MELKELIKKVILKDLKAEAKQHGIPVAGRTKMDIAKTCQGNRSKSWQVTEGLCQIYPG